MIKVAADSYRRAMQYRPNNKQLKKKLADVMLSKEDRLARKRRVIGVMAACSVLVISVGALAVVEHLNKRKFDAADLAATPLLISASQEKEKQNFKAARAHCQSAIEKFTPVTNVFSPVLKYSEKARQAVLDIQKSMEEFDRSYAALRETNARRADADLEQADGAARNGRIYDARSLYLKVLDNDAAAEKTRTGAKENLDKLAVLIDKLETGVRRVKNDPNVEFANGVEDEWSFKQQLIADFRLFPEFKINEIELPVLLKPDTDGVKVYRDGRFMGTVNTNGKQENIFRYTANTPHRFELKKKGYKTTELNAAEIRTPIYHFKLEREPAVVLKLLPEIGAGASVSGEPA